MTVNRFVMIALVVVSALSCDNSSSPVAPQSDQSNNGFAQINVMIKIEGDTSLAAESYSVNMDGRHIDFVPTGRVVPLTIRAGQHVVGVVVSTPSTTASWAA